jgi:hypothetical protein
VKNGVNWDVAFGVEDTLRTAISIIFSEMEGRKFNFNTMRLEDPA